MQVLEYMQKIDHILLKLIRILDHKHILICPIVDVTPAKIKKAYHDYMLSKYIHLDT